MNHAASQGEAISHPSGLRSTANSTNDHAIHPPNEANTVESARLDTHNTQRKFIQATRDEFGRLRVVDQSGKPWVAQTQIKPENMEDAEYERTATQKSSMSLTQENPASAYERFRSMPPPSQHDRNSLQLAKHSDESMTGHTYGEDDTGHVNLEFAVLHSGRDHDTASQQDVDMDDQSVDGDRDNSPENQLSQDLVSQDPPAMLPPQHPISDRYEPETPAPPVNPFTNRGIVMNGFELFGATQPSSVARAMFSPTSSRPSPDMNHFNSPQIGSSPLATRLDQVKPVNPLTSPLKSSSPPGETPQPRAYRSMLESQERRAALRTQDSHSGSDSDLDESSEMVVKRRKLNHNIQRQLSAVNIRRPLTDTPRAQLSSSFPSLRPAAVEIPSTSTRRRSVEEEYLAQCSGSDARHTQQEDLVADSQVLPDNEPSKSAGSPGSHHNHCEPDLSGEDARVPETSPPAGNNGIKPMEDIASFSLSVEEDRMDLFDLGGFTQEDAEFVDMCRRNVEPPCRQSPSALHIPLAGPIDPPKLLPSSSGSFAEGVKKLPEPTATPKAESVDDQQSTQDTTSDHPSADLFETTEETKEAAPEEIFLTARRSQSVGDSALKRPEVPQHDPKTQTPVASPAIRPSQALRKTPQVSQIPSPESSALSSLPDIDSSCELSPAVSLNKDELSLSGTDDAEVTPSARSTGRRTKRVAVPRKKLARSCLRKNMVEKKDEASEDADTPLPRTSSRRSLQSLRESSNDPLTVGHTLVPVVTLPKQAKIKKQYLFENMAFSISYKTEDAEKEKNRITKLVKSHGGRVLDNGFEQLFVTKAATSGELEMTTEARSLGFTALIANEYSRTPKYLQALALGLPCISDVWITACVTKNSIVDWMPYLLCAGESAMLNNAVRSRILNSYVAEEAHFNTIYQSRAKLLKSKSILLITGRGKDNITRKPHLLIAMILGPSRVVQVPDLASAKKKLAESEERGEHWDLILADKTEAEATTSLFKTFAVSISAGSRKRKSRSSETPEIASPPNRIRVIGDEVIIQSLIFGQLITEEEEQVCKKAPKKKKTA